MQFYFPTAAENLLLYTAHTVSDFWSQLACIWALCWLCLALRPLWIFLCPQSFSYAGLMAKGSRTKKLKHSCTINIASGDKVKFQNSVVLWWCARSRLCTRCEDVRAPSGFGSVRSLLTLEWDSKMKEHSTSQGSSLSTVNPNRCKDCILGWSIICHNDLHMASGPIAHCWSRNSVEWAREGSLGIPVSHSEPPA